MQTRPRRLSQGYAEYICARREFVMKRTTMNYIGAIVILTLAIVYPFVDREGGAGGMICGGVLSLGFAIYAFFLGRRR